MEEGDKDDDIIMVMIMSGNFNCYSDDGDENSDNE
jgi:hypothetical protein